MKLKKRNDTKNLDENVDLSQVWSEMYHNLYGIDQQYSCFSVEELVAKVQLDIIVTKR